jgi:hypothetical protein
LFLESLYLRETIDVRARGASKTFDTMKLALYLAYLGFIGIWFSSGNDQLEQPKKYLDYLTTNSFLKYLLPKSKDKLKLSVRFKHGGELRLNNATELNCRSSRADFIVWDEQAQVEEDAYRAGVSILATSNLGFVFHISTPVKATVFEENYERLRRREVIDKVKCVFTRRWDDIGFLYKNKEWYEEQKRILPGWYFRQEHECSFELPSGAVFKDVVYTPYPEHICRQTEHQHRCSGLDWNPAGGHVLSSVKWLPDESAVVVVKEVNLGQGYAAALGTDMFMRIAPYFTEGDRLVIEDGGINLEYVTWFNKMLAETRLNWRNQQWAKEEWDNQDVAKMAACTYVIQNGITIYVDKLRFPETAKQIEEAHWDEDAKGSNPKLAKDKANSPHFLDAFLHALSKKNRDYGGVEVSKFY